MKLALVADLHGNWPAVQAMDAELIRLAPDAVWFLGDAVGKGPDNALTCDWARRRCTRWIGGNWDYGIGGKEFPADEYYWDQLGPERMAWLNALPKEGDLWMSGTHFRLFHGRPVTELLTGSDARAKLESVLRTEECSFTGAIFADSHRPFVRTLNTGYIANTGSVGNSMGVPMAHGLMLDGTLGSHDPMPLQMTILSVPYDTAEAVRRAEADPALPNRAAYLKEITTGIYSR